jgi:hypothetical protein
MAERDAFVDRVVGMPAMYSSHTKRIVVSVQIFSFTQPTAVAAPGRVAGLMFHQSSNHMPG